MCQRVGADSGGDREGAEVVGAPAPSANRGAMKSASDRLAVGDLLLLAEQVEAREFACAIAIAVPHDVVVLARRRPEAVHARRGQQLPADDAIEQHLRAVVEIARRLAGLRMLKDSGIAALELPAAKKNVQSIYRHQVLKQGK